VGKRRDDLYYLVALASTPSTCFARNLIISSNLCHRRLGHLSSNRLQFLADNSLKFNFDSSHKCDVCPLAKQTRQPFPFSSISTSKCFSLIHCDIWGHYKTPSISGAFYFLTITDDFSRFTWVFLMRNKSETQTLLRQFFHYVHTQFNTKVQKHCSDNRAEFLSLKIFFLRKVFFFNTLVYIHLSKMVSLSANIDTSLKRLKLYVFNLIYPLLYRENVFLLPSILLIAFLLCCFIKKHHLRFFTTNFQIILACEFLDVLLLQP